MEPSTTTYVALRELAGNKPAELSDVQQYLLYHLQAITDFWTLVWCVTAAAVLYYLYTNVRAQHRHEQ